MKRDSERISLYSILMGNIKPYLIPACRSVSLVNLSQHWFEGSKQSKKEVGQGKFNIKFKEI
jgi:hypothetical protein